MKKQQIQATREQRIDRATELIRKHPDWGKDRVNTALQKEYGQGLQRIFVARLKSETLAATRTPEQKRELTLIKRGLLPSEAKALSHLPITAPVMREFIRERQALLREAAKSDVPLAKINQQIKLDYRLGGYTAKGKTDYDKAFKDWAEKFIDREKLKKDVAYSAPQKVTYTQEQNNIRKELRAAGFTAYEARILSKGDNTVQAFGTAPWRDAMKERSKWIETQLSRGFTRAQIRRELNAYYKQGKKRSPWDFIRENYIPKRKVVKSDFKETMARTKKQRATRLASRRVKSHFKGSLEMGL